MSNRPWHIYVLIDPVTEDIRYVGGTCQCTTRLRQHLREAANGVTPKEQWLKRLVAQGLTPRLEIVETGTGDWQACERKWVAHYKSIGAPITNGTAGGMGTLGKRWAKLGAPIMIRLEPSAVAALTSRSALTGRPVAQLAREAIHNYLRDVPATPQTPSWEREIPK